MQKLPNGKHDFVKIILNSKRANLLVINVLWKKPLLIPVTFKFQQLYVQCTYILISLYLVHTGTIKNMGNIYKKGSSDRKALKILQNELP